MGRVAAALSALSIGLGSAGCNSEPKVTPGVELTDPNLNRELNCARDAFQTIYSHNPLETNRWAKENCPGFDEDIERLRVTKDPLAELVERRKEISARAGVASNIETWRAPVSASEPEMFVTVNPEAVQAARKLGRVK